MILHHLTRKQRQLNPKTLIQLIPMHQLCHLRRLNSPVIKQPVQHKSINNDENNHEVKHRDDTPHPSLSCSTCNRQQIQLSENKQGFLLTLIVHGHNKDHDHKSAEGPDDKYDCSCFIDTFLVDLVCFGYVSHVDFIEVRCEFF